MAAKPGMGMTLKGSLKKVDGLWEMKIPVIHYLCKCRSIIDCIREIEVYLRGNIKDDKPKYKIKIMDGGVILISSSNFHEFVEFISLHIGHNADQEKSILELIEGIVIELEI